MAQHTEITFEEGWLYIQKGVTKLIKIIEGDPEPPFDAEQYVNLYTTVYNMCNHPPGYSKQLYEKYREVIEDYTIQTVLPSLREKHDENMLRELVKRWDNHKILVRWLSRFFLDVDCYLARRGIPRLREVGLTCFHELVYREVHSIAKEAVLELAEESLIMERERVTHYLHSTTEPKLLEKVQNELLVVVAKQLLEKEHSGFRAMLRDDKKNDLSRMYGLYHPIPQGLEPLANLFKQVVNELQEKYIDYVTECFQNNTIFHKGWSNIQKGIIKLIRILEGEPEPPFDYDEYMNLYTIIYDMCNQRSDYSQQLYDKYRKVIEDYTIQTVLPSLREKHDKDMLRELVKRWNNHKNMVKRLGMFFCYIDRHFVHRSKIPIPTLDEVGLSCFLDLVYHEMQSTVTKVVLALIHKEREGEQIDRALVKNVLDIYVENGMGTMEKYEEDFESFMLEDTASYYSRKASRWIEEDSCPDYMIKACLRDYDYGIIRFQKKCVYINVINFVLQVEESLKRERERVTNYLHSSTEPKVVEKIQNELLVMVAKNRLENEHSGCCALLRDDKKNDLCRIYSLYHPIPQRLGRVADLFKKHITEEGSALIKQADDATTNQLLIELHNKYMVYVTECFQNHTLFHKV
ncbi:unnamed protein product [Arabidopsis arenosa]|uniref:Cullin-5 n=1 Tax=Arabidopsis arenosa TaxID=38785 RepID=A0A8S1ZTF6_ARAAE|nr:unnamed protein product [Arabidopsis arenosa]